jgi:hypothetical protein
LMQRKPGGYRKPTAEHVNSRESQSRSTRSGFSSSGASQEHPRASIRLHFLLSWPTDWCGCSPLWGILWWTPSAARERPCWPR